MISPSRFIRLLLEDRFSADFNTNLRAACAEFDVAPYEISFDQTGRQNFYRGVRTLEELIRLEEPDFPALAMAIGPGQDLKVQKPRTFSGVVLVSWRFFLAVETVGKEDLTGIREATEAAMIATLDPEMTGAGYHGDLLWQPLDEQKWADFDPERVGWVQQLEFQANFGVNL